EQLLDNAQVVPNTTTIINTETTLYTTQSAERTSVSATYEPVTFMDVMISDVNPPVIPAKLPDTRSVSPSSANFHRSHRFFTSSTNSLSESVRYSEDEFYDILYDSLCLFPSLSNFSSDVWKSRCADSDIEFFISNCSFSEIYHAPFYINKVFFLKLLKCCRTLIRNYDDLFNVYSETNHLCYKYFHC
ncbi:unnamed protein product, partial [Schistosoma mattheei]